MLSDVRGALHRGNAIVVSVSRSPAHALGKPMHKEPQSWEYAERTVHLEVELPAHAVAAVTLEFAEDEGRGETPR